MVLGGTGFAWRSVLGDNADVFINSILNLNILDVSLFFCRKLLAQLSQRLLQPGRSITVCFTSGT